MKIKKGKLNYDQSGRAYPPNPRVKENWDCIWEYEGKHYKLVGDNEHKEWDEVNIYNQIIDEVYENYLKHNDEVDNYWIKKNPEIKSRWKPYSQEEFINKCKTDSEFSEEWGLKIEERELNEKDRYELVRVNGLCPKYSFEIENGKPVPNKLSQSEWYDKYNIPTKLITITYNNETLESYE